MNQGQIRIRSSIRQYNKSSIQQNGLISCKKQNCPKGVVIQFQKPQRKSEYRCLICDTRYCVICMGFDHQEDKCPLKRELQNGKQNLFQCQNCMQTKQIQDKVGFCPCGFQLCFKCYEEYLRKTIDQLQVPKCPSGCGAVLTQNLKTYLDDQSSKKYDKARFNKVVSEDGLKVCKKENCQNGIIIQTLNLKGEVQKQCPKCQTKYCKTCLQFAHPYKCNKMLLLELIQKLGYRMCDKCENLIQRNLGCSHMTCKCGYQFCYDCQQKYIAGHICPVVGQSRRQARIKKLKKQVKQLQQGKVIIQQSKHIKKEIKKIQKKVSGTCECSIM